MKKVGKEDSTQKMLEGETEGLSISYVARYANSLGKLNNKTLSEKYQQTTEQREHEFRYDYYS